MSAALLVLSSWSSSHCHGKTPVPGFHHVVPASGGLPPTPPLVLLVLPVLPVLVPPAPPVVPVLAAPAPPPVPLAAWLPPHPLAWSCAPARASEPRSHRARVALIMTPT